MEHHRPSIVSPSFLTRCYIAALAAIADPLSVAMKTADAMLYRAKQAGRNRVWPALELQPPEVDRRIA